MKSNMKTLIIGSTGMLGSTLKKYFSTLNHETKTLDRKELDLNSCIREELEEKIIEKKCDVLINCAGLIPQRKSVKTVDFISVNSLLPHRLSEICEKQNMKMIHITTDCVFSGNIGDYKENSTHDATDEYGRSKSMGEPKNCTVIRTSIIGEEEKNKLSLLEWVKSNKNSQINGYKNHLWNGITCLQLGKIIKQILDEDLFWKGVRHIFTTDSVNKFELVSIINEVYELNIEITPVDNDYSVDRSLSSIYKPIIENPDLHSQIKESKEFYDIIKNNNLD